MPTRWRRWKLRDVAFFVAVAAIVALVGVMVGCEAGIGEDTGTSPAAVPVPDDKPTSLPQQQSEGSSTLTLTLSAPEICETERGQGFAVQAWVYNDEGERVRIGGIWARVAEIPVRWEVTGGTRPYTLVIDNEPRDGFGPYEGASGTASVSCAPNPGKVTYNDYDQQRWYLADPEIDSGPKTIHATVTDATGATAASSISIYVIRQLGGSGTTISGVWTDHRLLPGRTYRYNGILFTIPKGHTIVAGSSWEASSGFGQSLYVDGTDIVLYINRRGEELYRALGSKLVFPGPVPAGVDTAIDAVQAGPDVDLDPADRLISDYLDDFIASRGKLPVVPNNQ